jgi:hypothetical protein
MYESSFFFCFPEVDSGAGNYFYIYASVILEEGQFCSNKKTLGLRGNPPFVLLIFAPIKTHSTKQRRKRKVM